MRPGIRRLEPAVDPILIIALATMVAFFSAGIARADGPLPADGKDFRAAAWGQSNQQIRRQEAVAPTFNHGPLLAFQTTVADQPCQVVYVFDDAKARRDELVQVWGTPEIERWDWKDPLLANTPSLRAEALGLGLVRYELGWMTNRSIAALRMSGGDQKADLVIMYADRTCFPASQKVFGRFFSRTVGVPTADFR